MLGVNIEPYFSIKLRVLIYFKFWESIVYLIFVSNFGCQYRTLFLNQTSGVNIDAAAAASLYFGWHIEILSQHYIIIVDNDLPEYLWTFQSQGSAGIAQAKRIRRTPPGVVAWIDPLQKSWQKPSWAGILHSYWPRDCRRPSPRTVGIASFFASFFSIDFRKAFVSFLLIFAFPWGPPKSSKIAKSRCRQVFFSRPYALLALLTDFDSFWVLSGAGPKKRRFLRAPFSHFGWF